MATVPAVVFADKQVERRPAFGRVAGRRSFVGLGRDVLAGILKSWRRLNHCTPCSRGHNPNLIAHVTYLPMILGWRTCNFTKLFLLHPIRIIGFQVQRVLVFRTGDLRLGILEIIQRTMQAFRRRHRRRSIEVLGRAEGGGNVKRRLERP